MNNLPTTLLLLTVLVVCGGFTISLTYAPCYASLCSEEFFPRDTRIHIGTYYLLLASITFALLLRAYSPTCRSLSNYSLTKREVPVFGKRISVGGLAFSVWILTVILVTTIFWIDPLVNFWTAKTAPYGWDDAKVSLVVTGIIGHHADIPLGLLLIPVGRNSILGRAFALHQHTLLYAHKLIAYLTLVAIVAHGIAYYVSSPQPIDWNQSTAILTLATELRGLPRNSPR